MNQREVSEIRRRFKAERSSITHIYGCYVNNNKDIISEIDMSVALMKQEEQEMYLNLLKKTLSGTLGRNLVDIEFATKQVADSDEHRLLQTLRQSKLREDEARETFYRKVIDTVSMEDCNYLILLAADTYDVPYRGKDGGEDADNSAQVYSYFVCAVCPVKNPTLALRFDHDENEFHSCSTGSTVAPPQLGFLFPAFDDRAANIYNALFYCHDPAQIHQEFVDAVFHVEPPMSAVEQRNVFGTALSDVLEQDCSFDVVQSIHEQVRLRIADHKESRDPEPLNMSLTEVSTILKQGGVSDEKVAAFTRECEKQYGADPELNPGNIIESKKYEVTTPEIRITVAPENSYLIESRIIGGRRYLLIPADDGVEINGIDVHISASTEE